ADSSDAGRGAPLRSATPSRPRCSRSAWSAARWTSRWRATGRATTTAKATAAAGAQTSTVAATSTVAGRSTRTSTTARGKSARTAGKKRRRKGARKHAKASGALPLRFEEHSHEATVREAPGGPESRRSDDDDNSREVGRGRGTRPLSVRAAQPGQQGPGAARAPRSGPADLSARSRYHHPLARAPESHMEEQRVQ